MNQTTAHLAALARALGGYPSPALCREHLIPMRALPPAAVRRVQHVSDPLRSVLAGRTPIRDARLALADRHSRLVACDRPHDLSARYLQPCVSHPRKPVTGLFYA